MEKLYTKLIERRGAEIGDAIVDSPDVQVISFTGHTSTGKRIDPYYLYLKLPDATSEHFIAIEPFVPVSSGNSINRLVSFLTADSDPGQYGKLQAFVMPQGQTVEGPVQVNNAIIRTPAISGMSGKFEGASGETAGAMDRPPNRDLMPRFKARGHSGALRRSEPGIHISVFMGSGFAAARRPGMTR